MQFRLNLTTAMLALVLLCTGLRPMPASARNSKAQKVVAFMDMVFNQKKVKEGFDKYVGDKYIQHNPIAPDGKEAAVEVLGKALDRRCPAGHTNSSTRTSMATSSCCIRT